MVRIVTRVALIVGLLAAGLSVGLIYGNIRLGKEQQIHQNKINGMNKKIAMLQKKEMEERDIRSGIEGRNHTLQAEVEKLGKENSEQAEEIKKLQAEANNIETKLKTTTEEVARMKASRDDLSSQLAQALQNVKNLEGQGNLLAAGKQTLEQSLTKVNQDLDVCRSHNARLCMIADEMLRSPDSASTLGTILREEPLTQIGKVELEKLSQEYKDKIEQEKLKIK